MQEKLEKYLLGLLLSFQGNLWGKLRPRDSNHRVRCTTLMYYLRAISDKLLANLCQTSALETKSALAQNLLIQNCDIKGPSAVVPVVTNFSNTFLINKPFLSCFEDREKNRKEKTNSTVISDIVLGETMVGGQSGKLPSTHHRKIFACFSHLTRPRYQGKHCGCCWRPW